jgi:hypothetical protein
MVNEVKDMADVCHWKYHIHQTTFPDNTSNEDEHDHSIYGISFTPPECEPVSLCFLSNRKLSSEMHLKLYGQKSDKQEHEYLYMLSVKTQFAGVEIHKFIIELFRYLKNQNYFAHLEIIDEGKYWETGDESLLRDIFKKYVDLLDHFLLAIECIPVKPGESYGKYFERLMHKIRNRNPGKDE